MEHELLCGSKHITANELREQIFKAIECEADCISLPCGLISSWRDYLSASKTKLAACVSYPNGTSSTNIKTHSIVEASKKGAHIVEIVVNNTLVADKKFDKLLEELRTCVAAASQHGMEIRAIVEHSLYDNETLLVVCGIVRNSGIETIITSTGSMLESAKDAATAGYILSQGSKLRIIATTPIVKVDEYDYFVKAGVHGVRFLSAFALETIFSEKMP